MTPPRSKRLQRQLMSAALAVFAVCAASSARAEGGILMELNKLESREGACRVYMLFTNDTQSQFDTFKSDLIFFDSQGVVATRIVVAAGQLPAGKRRLQLFDVPQLTCARIGHLLLNDVTQCTVAGKPQNDCGQMTSTASRAHVEFIK